MNEYTYCCLVEWNSGVQSLRIVDVTASSRRAAKLEAAGKVQAALDARPSANGEKVLAVTEMPFTRTGHSGNAFYGVEIIPPTEPTVKISDGLYREK